MTTYTPGPWSVLLNPRSNDCITANDCRICDMPKWDDEYADEELANARLIAAAPELLEACKLFIEYEILENGTAMVLAYNAAHDAIRAAIAKAEGGEA